MENFVNVLRQLPLCSTGDTANLDYWPLWSYAGSGELMTFTVWLVCYVWNNCIIKQLICSSAQLCKVVLTDAFRQTSGCVFHIPLSHKTMWMNIHKTMLQNQPRGGTWTKFEAWMRKMSYRWRWLVFFVLSLLARHFWMVEICILVFCPPPSSRELPFLPSLPYQLIDLGGHFHWNSEFLPRECLSYIVFSFWLRDTIRFRTLRPTKLWKWI